MLWKTTPYDLVYDHIITKKLLGAIAKYVVSVKENVTISEGPSFPEALHLYSTALLALSFSYTVKLKGPLKEGGLSLMSVTLKLMVTVALCTGFPGDLSVTCLKK